MIEGAKRLKHIGEYYFSRKLEQIRRMNAGGRSVLNLGIGSPDLPPGDHIVDALVEDATKPDAHAYQSYRGIEGLRSAMSHFYHEHYDVTLNPVGEILPLMGSKEGVVHISMAFLDEGDVVLVPNPGYPAYESAALLAGAEICRYDLLSSENWKPDLTGLDEDVLRKCKLMWVNYPNMPTGAMGTNDMFERLVAFARQHDILICNDNPYSFILNDQRSSLLSFDESMEHCLELNSLSKTFNMAGWRIGMVCGHSEYINTILKVKSNMDSGMFRPIQKAAIKALETPYEVMTSHNKIYSSRRILGERLLERLGCTLEQEQVGMFLWAKIPNGQRSEDFVDDLLEHAGVFMTPGTVFGSNGEGYVRLSLCSNEGQFEEAIMRVKTEVLNK